MDFSETAQFDSDAGASGVVVDDLNNDGLDDLILLHDGHPQQEPESDMIYIYYQEAGGTLNPVPQTFLYEGDGGDGFEVADINGNGWKDLIHVGQNSIAIHYQESQGSFVQEFLPVDSGAKSFTLGDFNDDGRTDIAWVSLNYKFGIFYQQDDTSFEHELLIDDMFMPNNIKSADFNNDGLDDILMGIRTSLDSFRLFLQADTGMLTTPITFYEDADNYVIGDFNNDGFTDLGTANHFESYLKIWYWNPDSLVFIVQTTLPVFQNSWAMGVADMDCNGYLDIINVPSGWGTVSIYPGSSFGFTVFESFDSDNHQTYTYALGLGDLNNDMFVDMAIGRSTAWGGEILYNTTTPSISDYEITDTLTTTSYAGNETVSEQYFIIEEIDSSGICTLIYIDSFKITQRQFIDGEIITQTVFSLEAQLCGNLFEESLTDEVIEEFDTLILLDTVLINSTIDTFQLIEVVEQSTFFDTLQTYTLMDSSLLVLHDTFSSGDTVFYVVDSLWAIDHYSITPIESHIFTIQEIMECGQTYLDSINSVEIMELVVLTGQDTLLISHNITIDIQTTVSQGFSERFINVFPNPSNDYVILELTSGLETDHIHARIANVLGQEYQLAQLVHHSNGAIQIKIETKPLNPGLYLILFDYNGTMYSRSFIKI